MPTTQLQLLPLLGVGEACHFAANVWSGGNFQDHRHDFHEFFWVISGRGVERLPAGGRALAAGSFACVHANDLHGFDGDPALALSFRNVAFRRQTWIGLRRRYGGLLTDWFDESFAGRRGVVGVEAVAELESAATALLAGRRDGLTLERFLLRLDEILAARRPGSSLPDWLARALADPAATTDVATFVDACGRSHEHVVRVCRRLLQTTPSAIVLATRLQSAARRLEQGGDVLSACYDAGFNNVGYFHRTFKARFGMTPRRYKLRQAAITPT